jgi:3'-5' exoribonuclease
MKAQYIKDLETGNEIVDFFMLKNMELKVGSNGKQFLDLFLADKTGEIRGKKWDVADSELDRINKLSTGDIIKIQAQVTEWNGAKQLRVTKIRKSDHAQDGIAIDDFFKAAPEDPDELLAFIEASAKSVRDTDFSKMAVRVVEDNRDKIYYYPAAAKNHHAMYAGLAYHMKRMLLLADKLCEVYKILNRDLLVTGVIFHDIEKINEMNSDERGIVSDYTFEGIMLGHLIQGVVSVDKLAAELNVPYEKKIMLEHMVLSHHYEADYGSPKKPLFPEAEALHYLDMIDAKIYDMEAALELTDPGKFSERIWTLDNRRIYKRDW